MRAAPRLRRRPLPSRARALGHFSKGREGSPMRGRWTPHSSRHLFTAAQSGL